MKTSMQPWVAVALTPETFIERHLERKKRIAGIAGWRFILRLSIDDAEFWISGHSSGSGEKQPENIKPKFITILLVVENPDLIFEQAIKEGAALIFPVGEE